MKKQLLILLFFSGILISNVLIAAPVTGTTKAKTLINTELTNDMPMSTVDDFLNLTPRAIREATGKKLTIKEIIQLKTAQKVMKNGLAQGGEDSDDMPKWLYIILGVFGLAWIVMGIKDKWDGKNWWMNIIFVLAGSLIMGIVGIFCPLLWALTFVPGLVHALVKMKEYY